MEKIRPRTKPDKLGGGQHGGSTNPVTESKHTGWSDHQKFEVKAGHGGRSRPWPVAFLTLSKPVYCLFAPKVTYPWNNPFFSQTPLGTTHSTGA